MFVLGQLLKEQLERYQDVEVLITRQKISDNPSLYQRGSMAKGCEILLSLHSDAVSGEGAEGVDRPTVFYPISGRGQELAALLTEKIAQIMGTKQAGKIKTRINSAGSADYYGVIRHAVEAGSVGMILEHSFHTNEAAAKWLMEDRNLKTLAKAEAAVLADYYGLTKPGEEEEMRYNTLGDLKADKTYGGAYLPTIEKLLRKGLLQGKGGEGDETVIDLSEDAVRILVINDRAGLYGN